VVCRTAGKCFCFWREGFCSEYRRGLFIKPLPVEAGGIIFKSSPNPPGYEIRTIGIPDKTLCEISGLQLVVEKLLEGNDA